MPREIVHWYVLDKAVAKATQSTCPAAAKVIENNLAAAYLGAMAYDAPYYYRFGQSKFEATADYLHGKDGEDTFIPLRELAAAVLNRPAEKRELLWAFLLGMTSHYATDIELHPAICYFTGDYYHPDPTQCWQARANHRAFEVYLDSWLRPRSSNTFGFNLCKMQAALGASISEIYSLLDEVLPAPNSISNSSPSTWRGAFNYMAIFQRCFFSPAVGLLASGLARLHPPIFSPIESLFTRGRNLPEVVFDTTLKYLDPVDGGEHNDQFVDLIDRATEETTKVFIHFEDLVSGKTENVNQQLASINGRSLSFGKVGAKAEDARYYANPGVALPPLP